MKGKVDILANFPIDTSLKKKTHSALLLPTPPPQPRSHFASRHYLVFAVCKDNRFVWNWHRIIMTFPCGDLQQKIFWVSSKVYRPLWCRFYLCSATNHQPDYIHQQGHKKCGWYRGRFYIYTFFCFAMGVSFSHTLWIKKHPLSLCWNILMVKYFPRKSKIQIVHCTCCTV